ncbi:MAG TPA: hypothetical protein PLX69_22495 [Leptospiraceae bacterium]|nr:hypothetical protein [Leptospiraceae bacterium]
MLNELYQLSKALEKNNISLNGLHADIKTPAASNDGLIIYLSSNGNIELIEICESTKFSQLWYFSNGNHGTFPVRRIQEPLLFDPNDSKQAREAREKKKLSLFEKWEELMKDLEALSIFPDDEKKSEQKAWEKYFSTLNTREKVLRENNDPELKPFLTLMSRFYKFAQITDWKNRLKEKITEQVKKLNIKKDEKINPKLDSRNKEFDFYFTLLKGKWDTKENVAKCGIQTFLELSDFENFNKSVRQSKEIVSRNLSGKLINSENLSLSKSNSKCVLSGDYDEIENEKYPNPNLPLLGLSYLFSMNANTPCQTRYGNTSTKIIPVGKSSIKSMKDSIEWICEDSRKGITWDETPGKDGNDLLIVYLEDKPNVKINFAKAFGNSEKEDSAESKFEKATESLLKALSLHGEIKQESKLKLFIIAKVDPSRRQLIQDKTFTIAELKKAISDWKKAVEQSFTIQIPESNFTQIKNPYIPLPTEFLQVFQRQWIRNGSDQSKVPVSISMSQVFDLFLNREYNLKNQCNFYLQLLWQRSSNLLIACGHSLHKGHDKKGKSEYYKLFPKATDTTCILQTISVFSIILFKLNLQKEDLMKNPFFLIGQLLSLADTLHQQYCLVKRNGSIPPQLLGNAHFQVVLQNPSQGFARLAERIPVYQAWAITDKTDDSKLAKWALKHLGIINKQLSEVTFPKSANDQEKAILLMGYLAKIEGDKNE